MSYQHYPQPPQQNFGLAATFVPGGQDDYYIPAQPELVSPAPQRVMQEDVDQIQNQVAHLELEANGRPLNGAGAFPPRQSSMSSNGSRWKGAAPNYAQFSNPVPGDVPTFSPFPRLDNPPPNVPPTDDEKEAILENARTGVLNSNDPEMQLAWAQDSLSFVDAAMVHAERIHANQPSRPPTPAIEHQLRIDAMNIVQFLADQRHPRAEFMRGMWLEFGKFGVRIDKKEAFRCYSRAADKQYWRAEYRIGMLFEQSNDPIKALIHYKRGADAGDSASNYRLGMMTLLGQNGQPQDYARGIQLIKHAANTADENAPQGAYVLGMLQARELPQISVPEIHLPYDEKSAKVNIEKAAFLGFAKAQLKMGSAYELCTLGCDFNPTLSLHYNSLAARQGEPEADMAISKWFLCGYEGVFQKNEELAYVYAERAAESGLATAEFALGYFSEIGVHVPVSLEKAMEWYERAAESGNKDAISRLENIQVNRTLSKRDHEKVAINKIRSQYGSKKGQRPDRFRASQVQPMPTISDSGSSSPALMSPTNGRPPVRSSSTAPYPLEDKPPSVAPYDRPTSAAPYPMDNGPPRIGGRPGPGNMLGPDMRANSMGPRPSSAFNVMPPGPGAPGAPAGRMTPLGTNYGPPRPHTSVDSMSPTGPGPAGRMPLGGQRIASGPAGYRQPGGPSVERPERMSPPASAPGSMGPPSQTPSGDGRNKLQKASGPAGPPVDIGFQAPIEQKKPPRLPAGYERNSTTAFTPGAGPQILPLAPTPGVGRPASTQVGARPGSSGGRPGLPHKADSAPPSKAQQPQPPNAPRPKPKPAQTAPAGSATGPKTFEEMGVPQVKQDGDCIVM